MTATLSEEDELNDLRYLQSQQEMELADLLDGVSRWRDRFTESERQRIVVGRETDELKKEVAELTAKLACGGTTRASSEALVDDALQSSGTPATASSSNLLARSTGRSASATVARDSPVADSLSPSAAAQRTTSPVASFARSSHPQTRQMSPDDRDPPVHLVGVDRKAWLIQHRVHLDATDAEALGAYDFFLAMEGVPCYQAYLSEEGCHRPDCPDRHDGPPLSRSQAMALRFILVAGMRNGG